MGRVTRSLGTLMIVAGVGVLAWAALVWAWQDPFTSVYTRWQQHKLNQRYEQLLAAYEPHVQRGASLAAVKRELRAEARAFREHAKAGDAIGHIRIPRIGLDMVLVNGTDHDSLTKGPGRDVRTFMPGEGRLIYVAGHRTTYLAPFSHIDALRPADRVTVDMPYGTFVYAITGHRIVSADDLSVLKSHGREVLALQACHPRFFASHRYIAYAKLVSAHLRGTSMNVSPTALAAAATRS